MHDAAYTVLTILTVVAAALLNRSDSKRTDARVDALAQRMDARFDSIGVGIVSMRERLARIEERIGIKTVAS